MTIKHTQKNGFSITNHHGEVLLTEDSVKILSTETEQSEYEITSPGEYEVADIAVNGLRPYPMFMISVEGFSVSYLPEPQTEIAEQTLSRLEQTDILLIPGKNADLVSKLAPSFVIPLNDATTLAEKIGTDLPDKQPSLKLSKASDLAEGTEIVYLG